jgi:hypothetical protein
MPSGIPPDITVVVNIVGSTSTMPSDSNDTRRRFLWGFWPLAIAPLALIRSARHRFGNIVAGIVGFVGLLGVGRVGVLDVLGGRRGVRSRCVRELGVGGHTCGMFFSSIVLESCPESYCPPGYKVEGAEAEMVLCHLLNTGNGNATVFLSTSEFKPMNR